MITKEEIRKIAQLAHLEITDEEVELYTPQMASIVSYVEQLNELETQVIEPATGGLTVEGEITDTSRADQIRPSLGQERALKEAPDALAGHFRVPKVL
jgi:aspartyl-tRNA(Asn)/glutamyl-tRNA(Gln) amidotransferase subunit C